MIITLAGLNKFLLLEELGRLTNEFTKQYGDMALEKIDCEEVGFERILESIQSLPFLANKKMVILRSPSANKKFIEQATALLGEVPQSTELVIVEPKLDKRLSYFKALKNRTEFREFAGMDAYSLAKWLVARAKERGGNIGGPDAQYLIERVGTNQDMLAREVDKLLTYNNEITRSNIDSLTQATPQSTIFELLDAAFAQDAKKVLRLYREQRELKVEPQQIVAMLAWQLHVLAMVKTAGNKSTETIAKEAKLNPFVVKKTQNIARHTTLTEVKRLIADALKLDIRLKSEGIDADDALMHYLLMVKR